MPTDLPTLLAAATRSPAPWTRAAKWRGKPAVVVVDESLGFVAECRNEEDSALIVALRNEAPALLAELATLRSQTTAALDVTSDALRAVRDETQKLRAEHMVATIARAALLEIAAMSPDPEDSGSVCLDKLLRACGIAHEAIAAIGTPQETP